MSFCYGQLYHGTLAHLVLSGHRKCIPVFAHAANLEYHSKRFTVGKVSYKGIVYKNLSRAFLDMIIYLYLINCTAHCTA